MSTALTPPIPGQRKIKLVASLKNSLGEQSMKLLAKHDAEQDLLEDVRNYAKQRASIEKEYAQAIIKVTSQALTKMNSIIKIQTNDEKSEETPQSELEEDLMRFPQGLWVKILEETEAMANTRLKISQTLLNDVADSIKNLKVERAATVKKCSALAEKLQEEVMVSATDLVKAQKTYSDLQKLTNQARQTAIDAQDKLQSGKVSILTSKAKLEKNASKTNERRDASEKRSTIARNDYLLTLAAINAHQRKYYSQDLPDLIAVQDGKIYENLKDYYTIITNIERDAACDFQQRMRDLEGNIRQLERAYVIMCFLKRNTIFTKCEPYEFSAVTGDDECKISEEYGAGLPLNKEARKWTLRLAREQKQIRQLSKKLHGLKTMSLVDTSTADSTDTAVDSAKTNEQSIESLTEEIRHLEVRKTKAEGRVEALKLAGVNVDEWMQQTSVEPDEEDENDKISVNLMDDDEFNDDEWDDSFPNCTYDNYSDDGLSLSSSVEPKRNTTNHAIVLYPFDATSQEELSITAGEELELLETESDGWCRTRNKQGDVGFVPETYIEVKLSYNTMSDDGDSVSKVSSKTSSVSEIQLDYSGTSLNYADITTMDTTPTPLTMGFQSPPTPITPVPMNSPPDFVCFAKAVYSYDAIEDEELSFQEGDVIMITSKIVDDDDGWWEGILNGRRGVFPCLLVEETKPPDLAQSSQDDLNVMSQNFYVDQNDISRSQTLGSYELKGLVKDGKT